MTRKPSKREAAETARRYLKDVVVDHVMFQVDEAAMWPGEFSWRVPVRPTHWPEKLSPVHEMLSEIEEQIAETEGLNILFGLAEPLDESPLASVAAQS